MTCKTIPADAPALCVVAEGAYSVSATVYQNGQQVTSVDLNNVPGTPVFCAPVSLSPGTYLVVYSITYRGGDVAFVTIPECLRVAGAGVNLDDIETIRRLAGIVDQLAGVNVC